MPLVSVVIPVYNRAELLKRALASLKQQTFQDFEVVVVDDHSTEAVAAQLKSVGKGVSAARNTGIRATTSPLVALLDSDDEWEASKLEKQVAYLDANPTCTMVHTDEIWLRNGQVIKQKSQHRKLGGRIFSECTNLCLIAPSSVLMRRTLLDRVGLFDEDFPVCEDFDLWLRITAVEEIGFLSDPLTLKHGGHTDQLSLQYHSMDLWRVRALAKHLKNQNLTTVEHLALRKSLRQKAVILLKGFEKHQNFEHVEEVQGHIDSTFT